ncbi:TadE family type IV pilus minor pilin [Catenuloplanes atrovinosus]|uniref:TadE family type IV pilus minor pilin n=1 Tax=Catenuloplanes atrovinosus TaxID=137266 RepID=UPI00286B470A|nr:TadE family type IV pilus minor pilin [Catenuloplanes atrovinosus]
MSGQGERRDVDRGAFTAEFAAALPALMLLLGVGLTVMTAVADRGRCYDAARDAALAAARGQSGVDAGTAAAPPGATVTVLPDGDQVRVVVTVPVRALGLTVPDLTASGEAVAAIEPGVTVIAE